MSRWGPNRCCVIAEHSMCQPGRPRPQGESQDMAASPGLLNFLWTRLHVSSRTLMMMAMKKGLSTVSLASLILPQHEIPQVFLFIHSHHIYADPLLLSFFASHWRLCVGAPHSVLSF